LKEAIISDPLRSQGTKRPRNGVSKVISNYIRNFPFTTLRTRQENVLSEIDSAFASGYKRIILEAPTGFGKSPVAISTALTLGPSYICTSTDLQSQYA
jgi:superfamily II DNA or RNA helicase